jgi:RimJ/RimL family protein N-acetyltransferase
VTIGGTFYEIIKLNLRKMYIAVLKENAGAVRCYTGVGFRQEGEQKEMWLDATTGKYASNLWLGLLKDEYLSGKGGKKK